MNKQPEEELAEQVLDNIRENPLRPVSVSELADYFNVGRDNIDRAVTLINLWGYLLECEGGSVTFLGDTDTLIDTNITYRLKTAFMGQNCLCYGSVRSTNDIALERAEAGAPEGTIVVAEEQTKGRGRFTRSWHSPSGLGVYVSIILRPAFEPAKAPGIAVMTALALAEAINKFCPGKVLIKWPNDVWIDGKKTAGILTELSAETDRINHIVIGVGININNELSDFPPELHSIATSVKISTGRDIDRVELLQNFLENLEREYLLYQKYQLKASQDKIRHYSALIGKTVRIETGKKTIEGKAVDIDETGCLVLEVGGDNRAIMTGEVTSVREG